MPAQPTLSWLNCARFTSGNPPSVRACSCGLPGAAQASDNAVRHGHPHRFGGLRPPPRPAVCALLGRRERRCWHRHSRQGAPTRTGWGPLLPDALAGWCGAADSHPGRTRNAWARRQRRWRAVGTGGGSGPLPRRPATAPAASHPHAATPVHFPAVCRSASRLRCSAAARCRVLRRPARMPATSSRPWPRARPPPARCCR